MNVTNDEKFFVSGWDDTADDVKEDDILDTPGKMVLNAAEKGRLDVLNKLLQENHSLINVTDDDGYTPLHRACYGNHVHVIKHLLANGADIHARTQVQWQPLHSACQWNNKESVICLLQHGADVNAVSEGGQTPLHIAASHGANYTLVQLLLMHPFINTQLRNNSEETAYDLAKRSSNYYNIFEMATPAFKGI